MHPWLNWIEYLTTNQAVRGSNPAMVGVASSNLVVRFVSSPLVGDFPYFAGVAELADAQDLKSCEG